MQYYRFEIDSILINSQGKSRIFISNPTELQEKYLGRIFGIIEIDNGEKEINKIMSVIRSIEDDYYEIDGQTPNDIDIESYLENKLHNLNNKLIKTFEEIHFSANLHKINSIISVLHKNNLFFVHTGNIIPFLIHKSKNNIYQLINILESVGQEPSERINPLKFYSNIVSGVVDFSDSLFFCNVNFPEFISLEKIKKTISTLSQNGTIEEFNAILSSMESIDEKKIFSGILVKSLLLDQEQKIKKGITPPIKSLDEMLATEEKTEKLLTPSIFPELKKIVSKFSIEELKYKRQKAESQSILGKIVLYVTAFFLQIFTLLKNIPSYIIAIPRTIKNITSAKFWVSKTKTASQTSKGVLKKSLYGIGKMPALSKILLFAFIVLFIVFAISVGWQGYKKTIIMNQEKYNQFVQDIYTKINTAEASLIYQDEEKARNLLIEAKEMLAKIPNKNDKEKEKYAELEIEIEELMIEIRHIVNIEDPEMIVNFESLSTQDYSPVINDLVASGNNIYVLNSENNTLYKINANDKNYSIINTLSINIGNLKYGVNKDDGIFIYLDEKNQIAEIDVSSESPSFELVQDINYSTYDIRDIGCYARRLYLLDAKNNQIYRHEGSVDGFLSAKRDWLKEPAELINTVSMAIDGDIYILNNDGQVWKYSLGEKDNNFQVTVVDPALSSPTKIFTDSKTNFIYILEPSQKRIVMLNRDGRFVKQFYSNSFDDLKDFIIFENEKSIYVLNGLKVYKIKL